MAQDGSTMGFANMPGMPNFMGMGGMGGMGMPSGGNLAGGGMMPQMPNMMMPPPMGGTGGAPGGTGNPMAGLLGGCCGGPGGENSGAPPDMASMMAGLGGMMGNMPRMPPMNPMALMMGMMTQAVMLSKSQATGGRPGDNSNPMASMMGGMGGMGGMPPMGNPMGMMGGSAGSSSGGPISSGGGGGGKDHEDEIDPEVKELGDYFNIEDRWIKRLNETMKKRKDTKEQDLAKLYEVLERARSPTGLLTVKIGEMECGMFVGKIKPDKDVERLARKFKLDDHVTSRLMELVVRRKAQKDEDLERIEQHLRYCKRPSAMATLLAGKLLEGEVDELPDLTEAEAIMSKYKLDEDARSKLREIVEKRAGEKIDILAKVKRHLDTSSNASSMLCKIARPLIDGEHLADPPDRPARGPPGGGGGGGGRDRGDRGDRDGGRGDRGDRGGRDDGDRRHGGYGRDRDRSRDNDRGDRDRYRDDKDYRDRRRDRSRSRGDGYR
mmetsp:Transcript_84360/g.176570  ORF Transcript_84360/g.176570 Transcript_84360/m.176570 type:complete len:493 (-) Transcript_84360:95-1573(-)